MRMVFQCPRCSSEIDVEASCGGTDVPCPKCAASVRAPAFTFGPGTIVGGYRLVERVGKGGSGEVYKALQLSMNRIVALKILAPAATGGHEHLPRFHNEIQLTARLDHPHIVPAYGAGVDQGIHFLAMSYVRGESLERKIEREGSLPERQALIITRLIAGALNSAWREHHILHRDVKPSNILLDPTGRPLLTDLGLSKCLLDDGTPTVGAATLGTPNYMSPEQVRGDPSIDCRADMYSLGATLYHMVTGSMPFKDAGIYETLRKQVQHELPDARTLNPDLSEGCARLLESLLAKDRSARPPDWDALIRDIDAVLAHGLPARRLTRRARRRMMAACAVLALGGGAAMLFFRDEPAATRPAPDPTTPPPAPPPAATAYPPPAATADVDPFEDLKRHHPDVNLASRCERVGSGWRINMEGVGGFSNLNLIAHLPVVDLSLAYTDVSDLTPLKGMPLRRLVLSNTRVEDLSPLEGLQLREIQLDSTPVRDISALKGMPLDAGISLARTLVHDLRPLQGMRLTWINLWETPVSDLSPLGGMRLNELDLNATAVTNLQPLAGMPLRKLQAAFCRALADISPLRGIHLHTLDLTATAITNLEPLAGMPLRQLNLTFCRNLTDISPLRGVELRTLALNDTPVTNLSPLARMPLEQLNLNGCRSLSDLSPLEGMPLLSLHLRHCHAIRSIEPLASLHKLEALEQDWKVQALLEEGYAYALDAGPESAAAFLARFGAVPALATQIQALARSGVEDRIGVAH